MHSCPKGHRYDPAVHASCPHCAAARRAAESGAVPATQYEQIEPVRAPNFPKPVLPPPPAPQPVQTPRWAPPVQPAPAAGGQAQLEAPGDPERLMGFLVITEGREDERWRYFRLRQGTNHIGPVGTRSEVELHGQEVSRPHALLVCTDAATRMIDLDSAHGTGVNGQQIEFAELAEGDVLSIGRTELTFVPFGLAAEEV